MARSNPKLDAIYDVFEKHGVDLSRDSIWQVQGTPVVKHKDVERLGAELNIKYDAPTIIRAERDEAVILVVGRLGDRMEWSIGEALIVKDGQVGGNYRVTGKQAGYVYAMAEKRAKDRVILKLADLHGDVYSDQEADEFSDRGGRDSDNDNAPARREGKGSSDKHSDLGSVDALKDKIDACKEINDVTSLMLSKEMRKSMRDLDVEAEMKAYATGRLKDLGWGKKTGTDNE